jgi:hypothetical protein
MSKYDRIDPILAANPVPHMRIYGRTHSGTIRRIVVHCVENGNVYGSAVTRGIKAWPLKRWSLADWESGIREACAARQMIGVQVPKIEVISHAAD